MERGSHSSRICSLSCLVAALAATAVGHAAVETDVVALRLASELARPVFAASPPGDSDRLFVIEQLSGKVRILDLASGAIRSPAFHTESVPGTSGEQGLLGLAFDPDYATNGRFYLNIANANSQTRVLRYQVDPADPDLADPASGALVLQFAQPFSNHNGGWIGFGPDGLFYIASGDGGSAGDPQNNAQDLAVLLGKLLRIDPDGDDFPADPLRNYRIPSSNPFALTAGAAPEIWAYGLRNPWRVSFDRGNGDLYIGDVGQASREEIDFRTAASGGGENYGWRVMEGDSCYDNSETDGNPPCNDPGFTAPIYVYSHGSGPTQGVSVTGGYVYRGPIASLQGRYFFADFGTAHLWALQHDGSSVTQFDNWTDQLQPNFGTITTVASFGEDAAGNLFILTLDGQIFQLAQTSSDLCSGRLVALQDWTAPPMQVKSCNASHSISTFANTTVATDGTAIFDAPLVVLGPGLLVADGGVLQVQP